MNIAAKYIAKKPILQKINNACGGYALASVLPSVPDAVVIYGEIQAEEKAFADKERQDFLSVTEDASDHSRMSLPSAIAAVAKKHSCKVKVYCNGGALQGSKNFGPMYSAEINSLGAANVDQNAKNYSLPSSSNVAHLVLVNNGAHWVAVDYANGAHHIYDPAHGGVQYFRNYAGLYLELSQ